MMELQGAGRRLGTVIRVLNYFVFIVFTLWAGMEVLAWNHPAAAVLPAIVAFCSGAAMRYMYVKNW
jgi:hypothetical protein